MGVYLINSSRITDEKGFAAYPSLVASLLKKYDAEVIALDTNAFPLEGEAKSMNAIIWFRSEEAVRQCYNDPEYDAIKKIRHATTSDCSMIVVKELSPG